MKRVASLLLSAALLLGLLSACQKDAPSDPVQEEGHTARELADAALLASGYDESSGDLEYLTEEEGGEEYLAAYVENAYHLELPWKDAAVLRGTGASAFELAVLRMGDESAAVRAASSLMSYIAVRQGDFVGYAPDQADMVANGGIVQKGAYAGLFICPDPDGARAAVEAVLDGEDPFSQDLTAKPSAAPGSALELKDVLHRLLLEYACPEWGEGSLSRAWSEQRSVDVRANADKMAETAERTGVDVSYLILDDMGRKYGVGPEHYEVCAYAWWDPDALDDLRPFPEVDREVAVFRSADEDQAKGVADTLSAYLERKTEECRQEGTPEVLELLKNAAIAQSGRYTALIVGSNAEQAARAFSDILSSEETDGYFMRYIQGQRPASPVDPDDARPDRYRFTRPNKEDMSLYDTSAIRTAWEGRDPSGLSKEDRRIYDEAEKVLKAVTRDGMSDYEKELAVYEWIVDHVDYDWTHQNVMVKTPRESFTPYGGLVDHTAVCLGYATTFQLLCDLAGVECITVVGAAFESREDHAWNMVRLDGEWYCLDVTWDANQREQIGRGRPEDWDHFNVTSDIMADSDHQWDYANTPEATAEDQGRG